MSRKQYDFSMKSKATSGNFTAHVDATSFEIALKAVNDAYGDGFEINQEPTETRTDPAEFVWTGIHCD